MKDFVTIGSSPCDEPCAQLGSENYLQRAKGECLRFIDLIRSVCGQEPVGAFLAIKGFAHDFGTYYEVVCWFDDAIPESIDYAFHVEGNSPLTWNDEDGSNLWKGGEKL